LTNWIASSKLSTQTTFSTGAKISSL
jgi:hypothetical protein